MNGLVVQAGASRFQQSVFAQFFSTAADDDPFVRRHPLYTPCSCTLRHVSERGRCVQQIKGNSSRGPGDGVQGVVLKCCAAALAPLQLRGVETAAVVSIPEATKQAWQISSNV